MVIGKVRIEGYVRIHTTTITTNMTVVKAANPFSRLKAAAKKSSKSVSSLSPVKITKNNQYWKEIKKSKKAFVPFKLEDKNGNPVSPNKNIILKNGNNITAQEFINKANEYEKKLNNLGFSLRDSRRILLSKTITAPIFLDQKVAKTKKSIAPRRLGNNLKNYMNPNNKVGGLTLKPYSTYSNSEKQKLKSYRFSEKNGNLIAKKVAVPLKKAIFKKPTYGTLKNIYEVDKTKRYDWNFGNPNTFQASIEGSINYYAKIYPFNEDNPNESLSEFRVKAIGKAKGSLFGYSQDILNASAEFYAPAKTSEKMTARITIKAVGTTLFNINKKYTQSVSYTKIYGKSFDKSFPIQIPIGLGIDFKGLIGIKGEAGFEYGTQINRTFVQANAKPIVDLEGYAEAGVEFLGLLGGGVGGNLTFIKGDLALHGFAGLLNQNSEELLFAASYYFDYDLNILSGFFICIY